MIASEQRAIETLSFFMANAAVAFVLALFLLGFYTALGLNVDRPLFAAAIAFGWFMGRTPSRP